ncbi:hypothetical protein [Brevifollis gellanilyticus]|uniref:Sialidase domain-containing protein n=1 Tax=Brevifollis gellanilyticus TaxID=748831 RepID=A0A512M784_9BACT|nr:hypothetical protein [Brevifollis gellanilyticus]GEP42600.1 hypothetical protein BGE01nite_18910 [Brevifollis gellanilyticus]
MKSSLILTALYLLPWLVSAETLLFVDDHEILYRPSTKRTLHQPVRHEANPLIVGPSIKHQIAYCSVHRDEATGRYQMWYQMTGAGCVVCYAESKDGITWTKPELDILTFKGIPDRNVVLTSSDHYDASVVVDAPGGADPARRYKMAYWSIPEPEGVPVDPKEPRGRNGGMYVAFSPDGIHWTKHEGPVLLGTYGRITDPPFSGDTTQLGLLNSVSDVIDATYDPVRKKYVVIAKGWIDGPDGRTFWKRSVVRTESDDFIHWSPARQIITPDEHDGVNPGAYPGTRQGVQLHSAPAFAYQGVWLGLIQLADFETHGQQPIELALSRDHGFTWTRPFRDSMFLSVGKPDAFDTARIWSNATPVVLEDEIRFYFGGAENPWGFGKREKEWGSKLKMPKTGIGLATLPLDRFAGLKPLERIGQITLKPRSLKGVKSITVNTSAVKAAVRVELLDAQGYRIPGFAKTDATPITGDHLRHAVSWKEANLSKLPDGEVVIRIHLDRAEVFALTLNSDPS